MSDLPSGLPTPNLPKGWCDVGLNNVCELRNGRAYKKSELLSKGPYRVLRVGNFFTSDKWYYSDLELPDEKYCDTGDLLYAWSASFGPRIWDGEKVIYHYHIWRVDFETALVERDFLFRWFEWDKEEIKAAHGTGSTMIHVTKGAMEKRQFPLPPLAEQRRIVEKLDALSAQCAAANAALTHIETLITRYKAAVLAAAFSGFLTKSFRKSQSEMQLMPQEVDRVRKDRASINLKTRKTVSDEESLQDLPMGWAWVSPDELACDEKYSIGIGPFGSSLVKGDYRDQGVRLVFVRDIRSEDFTDDGAKFVTQEKAQTLKAHQVHVGDVLITKMGDPPGDTAIFESRNTNAIITADCIKLRVDKRLSTATFIYYAIRSVPVQRQIAAITQGVAHQKVSLERFRRIAIPLPPLEEQAEIIARIEAAFAEIETLARATAAARARLGQLDRALLTRAFQGKLVPQNPSDEPASELLKRVKEMQP